MPERESAIAFDHVAHQVPNVAAAVRWYCEHLPGCRVLYEDESWAFVQGPGVKLAFVLEGRHPDHIGWRVTETELERLAREHDQTIRAHRDKTRSFYVKAPGGRWIEFIAYPDDTPYG